MDEPALKIDTGMAEKREVRCAIYPWMALLNVYRRGPRVNSFFVKFTCIARGAGCALLARYNLFIFLSIRIAAWSLGW